MDVGLLQCGAFPTVDGYPDRTYTELYGDMLAPHDIRLTTYDVEHMQFPQSVDAHDGWLISGSRHGAYEDHPFIPPLEEFLRSAYAQNVPLVGVCFGHQILAKALGGTVEKFQGGWSCGPNAYEFEDRTATLLAWHQDQVTQAPDMAEIAASTPTCKIAALNYQGRAFSVQPHPEFDDAAVRAIADGPARALVPEEVYRAASARLGAPLDNAWMAARIAEVFKAA